MRQSLRIDSSGKVGIGTSRLRKIRCLGSIGLSGKELLELSKTMLFWAIQRRWRCWRRNLRTNGGDNGQLTPAATLVSVLARLGTLEVTVPLTEHRQ